MYKILDDKVIYILNDNIIGEVCFEINGNKALIYHTYVDSNYRGMGIASVLMKKAFKYLEKDYIVECSCSYAKTWAIKHGKL